MCCSETPGEVVVWFLGGGRGFAGQGVGVHDPANTIRLNQRDMRPSAARSVEVACHSRLISAFFATRSEPAVCGCFVFLTRNT